MSKNGKFTRKKKRGVGIWILLTLLILLLGLLTAAIVMVISSLNKINRVDPNVPYISPEEAQTMDLDEVDTDPDSGSDGSEINWPAASAELIGENDDIVNILLIGQDRRPGEARARSDSMILVSVNKEKGTLTLISFLRDNYVQIPGGYYDNRLNVAYALGGMSLLDETLEVNFGVKVAHNVEVDFNGFTDVIDLLGGVDVEMTSAEAAYLNGSNSSRYTSGMNHLNGAEALSFSRIRKLDSDFGRTNRQRRVLNALFQKFKNISVADALALAGQIFPMLTTDMSNGDMIQYVTELLPVLANVKEIRNISIPGDSDYYNSTIRGMMVLVPDLESCRQVLAEALQ